MLINCVGIINHKIKKILIGVLYKFNFTTLSFTDLFKKKVQTFI